MDFSCEPSDVSSRALREAETRHRQIVDSASDTAIISLDLQGRVTSWNTGAALVIGYTESEAMGRSVDFIFTPEDREGRRMQAEMAEALVHGIGEHEGWRVRKDDVRFWASGQLTPLRDDARNVTGYVKIVRDRTAERRARQAFEAAQEHLRLAESAGGIGTFVLDVGSNELTVTTEFCRIFGLEVQPRMRPEQVERLILADDRPQASNAQTRREGSAPPTTEYRIGRLDDGAVRWIFRKAEFIRDGAGNVLQMVGVAQDITERRQAEQALRESEAQFRTFAQAVPNQVWTSPPDGKLDWLNGRVYEYSGLGFDELCGDGWATIVHPGDRDAAAAIWRDALGNGNVYQTEFRLRRADGCYRWHLARAVPIVQDGRVIRWVGTNTDIEEQKAALAVLAASNESLATRVTETTAERDRIWRNSRDLVVIVGKDGVFRSINPVWTTILGHRPEDVVGRSYLEFVWPDDADVTGNGLETAASSAGLTDFENRYRHLDGTPRWISWRTSTEGDVVYAYGRDVTADREQAAALQLAEEQLRQSQKMEAVGQLTGGLAHDFNNLLTGITGSLELLQARLDQGRHADIPRYVQAALKSAKRAAALTHRLLAFSRRQTLDSKPTRVNRLIADMEDLIHGTVGPEVQVDVVGAAGLWNTLVDPHQLENALLNLCINARHAMPDGGRLTIETANRRLDARAAKERDLAPGQYISVCVTDTGTGMSRETAARAFEPFFTTKPIGMGTGLGLSMIYGFARQSGGQVRIDSELEKGTTICLYLPRHHGDEVDDDPPREQPASAAIDRSQAVLVVDDESTVRMLVVDVLVELGLTVLEADDGASALKILQSDARIDLLITDVGLPGGMNGRQVADAARSLRRDLRVLFITGYAENAAIGDGHLAAGMQVLTKPFAVEELAARIRALV